METAVDEIGRGIDEPGPADGVRADERDAILAQQPDELLGEKAVVTDFDGMAQRAVFIGFGVSATLEAAIVAAAKLRSLHGGLREKLKELFQQRRVKGEVRRELPEDGPKLRSEEEQA